MDSEQEQSLNIADLVEAHHEVLFRYAYRLTGRHSDAEDLTQQAYMTAHKKLDQLRDPDNARSWLFTIARNCYLKTLRSQPSVAIVSMESVGEPEEDLPTDELAIDTELLQRVLDEMPEEFRTPLILFYFQEFSYKEIAVQLEVPIGTVMSRLARGKSYLRRRLAGMNEDLFQTNEDSPDGHPARMENIADRP